MCVELYRWSIELEGIFVLPLAPRWVRHSYLSKKATNDPLYLWVITLCALFDTANIACIKLIIVMKEICPRGNNKVVTLYFLFHDKGLLFMLELY